MWFCDWVDVLFVHYEVPDGLLESRVACELDRFQGRAYVSLVSFTMSRFRPAFGGRFAEWCFLPFATTRFLNVRTYVTVNGELGIHFLAE